MKYIVSLLAFFFALQAHATILTGDTTTCTLPDGSFNQDCIFMTGMPTPKMSPKQALQSGTWYILSLNGLSITSSGTLTFSGGNFYARICNVMNGRYSVTAGGKLLTRQIISTMMYCEGDGMKVEQSLGSVGVSDMMVGSDTLTLHMRNGDILVWKKK